MLLGVNIDHIATLRNARGGFEPDLIECAKAQINNSQSPQKASEVAFKGFDSKLRQLSDGELRGVRKTIVDKLGKMVTANGVAVWGKDSINKIVRAVRLDGQDKLAITLAETVGENDKPLHETTRITQIVGLTDTTDKLRSELISAKSARSRRGTFELKANAERLKGRLGSIINNKSEKVWAEADIKTISAAVNTQSQANLAVGLAEIEHIKPLFTADQIARMATSAKTKSQADIKLGLARNLSGHRGVALDNPRCGGVMSGIIANADTAEEAASQLQNAGYTLNSIALTPL